MKKVRWRLLLIIFTCLGASFARASEEIVFELYPQTRPYIYSVGFKYRGTDRWYQLEWSELRDGKSVKVTCDVFYDSISKNFYCSREGRIVIIPVNRPFKLKFHETAK